MSPVEAKVGIVEDDEFCREDAVRTLEDAGHIVVVQTGDLATAKAQLDELVETPDVYLIDGSFPNRPGGMPDQYLGAYFASLVKKKFGDKVRIVMFSSREENQFGQYRFPEKGVKTSNRIKAELAEFVDKLP